MHNGMNQLEFHLKAAQRITDSYTYVFKAIHAQYNAEITRHKAELFTLIEEIERLATQPRIATTEAKVFKTFARFSELAGYFGYGNSQVEGDRIDQAREFLDNLLHMVQAETDQLSEWDDTQLVYVVLPPHLLRKAHCEAV